MSSSSSGDETGASSASRVIARGLQVTMIGMALLGSFYAFRDNPAKALQLSAFLGVLSVIPIFLLESEIRKMGGLRYQWDDLYFTIEKRGAQIFSSRWSDIESCKPAGRRQLEFHLSNGTSTVVDAVYHPRVRSAITHHLGANASFPVSNRTKKSNPTNGLVLSLLLLPVFAWVSFSLYREEAVKSAVYSHPAVAMAEITHLDVRPKNQDVTYTFFEHGAEYTRTQQIGPGRYLDEGQKIQIAYDTTDPRNSILWFGAPTFPEPGIPLISWFLILFMPFVSVSLFVSSLMQILAARRGQTKALDH